MNNTNAFPEGTKLGVSPDGRFLRFQGGCPFFWLADTGWLLFQKLTLEEAALYLDDRKDKGFNVIMTMMQNSPDDRNVYGHRALKNASLTETFCGCSPDSLGLSGYWDHISRVVDMAAERGLFIALLPAWGSFVKSGCLTKENGEEFATWIARRFRKKDNIIWVLGGDIRGDRGGDLWNILGRTIRRHDPSHLISFHPFGRTSSSRWFHGSEWLDFHMFQSGHRYYDQSMGHGEEPDENLEIGPDNWRYVQEDRSMEPPRPTLDGEPSYEGIPRGLHDPSLPRWKAGDVRRYAYWSVLSGACGHTYGNNSVMQMYDPRSGEGAYGARKHWRDALDDDGASQLKFLKDIILSLPYFDRIPAQETITGGNGERYGRVLASRGQDYLLVYWYEKRRVSMDLSFFSGESVTMGWMNPSTGRWTEGGGLSPVPPWKIEPPAEFTKDALLLIRTYSEGHPAKGKTYEIT